MDEYKVKGTTYRFETPPEGGRGAELLIERRDAILSKARKVNGKVKPAGETIWHGYGRGKAYSDGPSPLASRPNLLTTKMTAPAGSVIEYGDGLTAVVWSPGYNPNTVWATTPDRKFVHLRKLKDGSWFEDRI